MNVIAYSVGVLSLVLSSASGSVFAAVSDAEAAKLSTELTPVGAQRQGNADGSIPAWTGGLPKNAGAVDAKGFLADPFPQEKPLFIITAKNVDQYKSHLTPGQIALLARYPDSYTMPVYPTHRTANLPDNVIKDIRQNAVKASLVEEGNGVEGFTTAIPFPIPKTGLEVIWNHLTRYRGLGVSRVISQVTPQTDGSYSLVRLKDQFTFAKGLTDYDPVKQANFLFFFKQEILSPTRLSGTVVLLHETLNQVKEPRMSWVYNAGQRRVRRAPQIAYDGPGTASDGTRTSDNYDLYNGSPDRYDWKLEGKKEVYIPYNSYRLDSPTLKYDDLVKAGHINQTLTRYELHRVWHVVATLKPEARHIYSKRDFYIDEDTWQIATVDHYDGRGTLWRVAEGHPQFYYNQQIPWLTVETLYDLISGRYLALGFKNEESQAYDFNFKASTADYTPTALRQSGVR